MFIPFLSTRSQPLYKRKGGGGHGGGSSKGGGSSSSSSKSGSSSSSSSSTSSSPKTVPVSGSTGKSSTSASTYGTGGGKVTTIPSGSIFSGRSVGGGTRTQVYGSSVYGSGYPGYTGRGVNGRGFPFYYWPVVFGGTTGYGAPYLYDENEYGDPTNSSRPGGSMTEATFVSHNTTLNNTYHVLADNSTTTALIDTVLTSCSQYIASSVPRTAIPYNSTTEATWPKSEQAIQYYRASSVVLTLDGYNNTAALSNDTDTAQTPLPSNIDTNLLNCLNTTIGASVPLVDGAGLRYAPLHSVGLMTGIWIVWSLLSNMI